MDRQIIYPGQIPLETDLLDTNRFAMIGLGRLAGSVLGTTATQVSGLAATMVPLSSPPQIQIAPGEIYGRQTVDGSAYSSLSADSHPLMKQGLLTDPVVFTCSPPTTPGQSINYLIVANYQDSDDTLVTLPYYNASNPTQTFSGQANNGTAQATVRRGLCSVTSIAGVAAATGSQTTPSAGAGYIPLYVVTATNGQTNLTWVTASGAPFITSLPQLATSLSQLAPLVSPTFTGTPMAPTPAQFDISTKLATTAFVKTAGWQFGAPQVIATTQTLTPAQAGKFLLLSGTPAGTVTLPAVNSVPAGTALRFCSQNNAWVVAQQSADKLILSNTNNVASISMAQGETLDLVTDGISGWFVVGGSAALKAADGFLASLTSNGYQKLPSGLILQWGSLSGYEPGGIGTDADWFGSFPMAFPNALLGFTVSGGEINGSNESAEHIFSAEPSTKTTINIRVKRWYGNSAGSSDIFNARYFAVGY